MLPFPEREAERRASHTAPKRRRRPEDEGDELREEVKVPEDVFNDDSAAAKGRRAREVRALVAYYDLDDDTVCWLLYNEDESNEFRNARGEKIPSPVDEEKDPEASIKLLKLWNSSIAEGLSWKFVDNLWRDHNLHGPSSIRQNPDGVVTSEDYNVHGVPRRADNPYGPITISRSGNGRVATKEWRTPGLPHLMIRWFANKDMTIYYLRSARGLQAVNAEKAATVMDQYNAAALQWVQDRVRRIDEALQSVHAPDVVERGLARMVAEYDSAGHYHPFPERIPARAPEAMEEEGPADTGPPKRGRDDGDDEEEEEKTPANRQRTASPPPRRRELGPWGGYQYLDTVNNLHNRDGPAWVSPAWGAEGHAIHGVPMNPDPSAPTSLNRDGGGRIVRMTYEHPGFPEVRMVESSEGWLYSAGHNYDEGVPEKSEYLRQAMEPYNELARRYNQGRRPGVARELGSTGMDRDSSQMVLDYLEAVPFPERLLPPPPSSDDE